MQPLQRIGEKEETHILLLAQQRVRQHHATRMQSKPPGAERGTVIFFAVAALLASEAWEKEQKAYLLAFVIIDLPAPASPHREPVSRRLAVPEFRLVADTAVPVLIFSRFLAHATAPIASIHFPPSFSTHSPCSPASVCCLKVVLRLSAFPAWLSESAGVRMYNLRP